MTTLTLFYTPGTCALATRIALEEAGADYQLHLVDFRQQAQRSPEFLAINPLGRVPALRLEDGTVLTENIALLTYIAQRYPQAQLAPTDAQGLAQMQGFNSFMSSTVHVAHAHKGRGSRWSDDPAAHESMKAKVPHNMRDAFTLIEHHHLRGPWVLGERYSVADAYLFTISGWLALDGVDIAEFPRVAEHHQRMQQRPAVQAALRD